MNGGMKPDSAGTLTIAAVPIGCLDDASPRLAGRWRRAQIIAAEDTRRLRRLAAGLGVSLTATVVSFYDAVEERKAAGLAEELAAGRDVLLVTDAGMPERQRPRIPPGDRGRGRGSTGDGAARAVRRDRGARRVRAAVRPVLLRGIPAAAGR